MVQARLFTNEQCPPPRRPRESDASVKEAGARLLLASIRESGLDIGKPDDEALQDLIEIMPWEDDGFAFAKELDGYPHRWNIDSDTVEMLNDSWGHISDARRDAVKEWVAANSIRPALAIGARVRFTQNKTEYEGVIDKIDDAEAQYVVFCEALGHVRQGTPEYEHAIRHGGACTGTYVNYEDAIQV